MNAKDSCWLAVDAVYREPRSSEISLLPGKNTGNFGCLDRLELCPCLGNPRPEPISSITPVFGENGTGNSAGNVSGNYQRHNRQRTGNLFLG